MVGREVRHVCHGPRSQARSRLLIAHADGTRRFGNVELGRTPFARGQQLAAGAIGNSSHLVKTDAVIDVRCPSWARLVDSPNPHALNQDLESPNGPVAAQN